MKAILKDDIIVKVGSEHGTEIGDPDPNIPLNFLRWDGEKLVDIRKLDSFYVEHIGNNQFILHVTDMPGRQLVKMRYRQRKNLVAENGKISLTDDTTRKQKKDREKIFNKLDGIRFTGLDLLIIFALYRRDLDKFKDVDKSIKDRAVKKYEKLNDMLWGDM